MTSIAVRFPVAVVIASCAFNAVTFAMALQQGRFSVNSLRYLVMQAATLPAAMKGDLTPWLQVQGM